MAMTDDLGPGASVTPEELYRQYYRPVVYFFARRGFSREESRDLAQETFLRVYKNKETFRGESSEVTWLFQIAANLYKNTLRSHSTQKRDGLEVSLEASGAETGMIDGMCCGHEKDALVAILVEERARKLHEALEDLPPQMRQAVILRVDQDLKYREIADVMRVSIETVKAHLYQARPHLRDKLADYFTDVEF
jgi:RNA polymerase sigma-70 factor (ECF subfamily)